jgi:dienelactone hydrolase
MKTGVVMSLLLVSSVCRAEDAEAIGKSVANELAARAFDRVSSRFDTTMASALPTAKLQAIWDGVIAQAGPWQRIKSIRVEKKDAFQVVLITAAFARTDLVIKLALDHQSKVAGLFFLPAVAWTPPSYANAALYDERELTLGAKGELPAILALPKGAGPFAAVVLVHGSGPNDRDETLGPNKLFKDLALGLASRGVAVLRYDKRTLKLPSEFKPTNLFTVKEEVIDDVRAAVTLLGTTAKIDPKRIFVLGHSLGGMLAPRIAAEDPRVAGIIMMAGNTRPIEEAAVEQIRYLTNGDTKLVASVEQSARQIRSPQLTATSKADFLGASIPGSYWLDLRKYHPAEVAASLTIPILVLQGQRDYQVTMQDFNGWKRALSDHANAAFKLYPSLNHLFLSGSGPSKPDEYAQPGHAPQEVIDDIANWIQRNSETRK